MTKEFDTFMEEIQKESKEILDKGGGVEIPKPVMKKEMSLETRVDALEKHQWKLRTIVSSLIDIFHMMKRKVPRKELVEKIDEL